MKNKEKEIKKFNKKSGILNYLKNKFIESDLIIISGSTAHGTINNCSDIDLEVHGRKIKNPYYELIFLKNKIVLISVYFREYNPGKKIHPPKNIKVIKGVYTDKIDKKFIKMYSEGVYNQKEKIKRECQLVLDFCFKYFRSKDNAYLGYIQKRIR